MPVAHEVRENGRLLYWEISDPWTTEDVITLITQADQYILNASQPIYSFVDAREVRRLPKGLTSLLKTKWTWQPTFGAEVILVIQSAAVRAMIQLLFRLARSKRAVIFDTYQAAWDYTQQLLEGSTTEGKAGSQ